MPTLYLTCGCYAELTVEVADHRADTVEAAVRAAGWVTGERIPVDGGEDLIDARCSVECHNQHKREWDDRRRSANSGWWWNEIHGFEGSGPECTCSLKENDEGLLVNDPDPDCPWHLWFEQWRQSRNAIQEELFEQWKNVPVGTAVFEKGNKLREGRGLGTTSAPPKLIQWSTGGFLAAMVSIKDWRPNADLEDLELAEEPCADG